MSLFGNNQTTNVQTNSLFGNMGMQNSNSHTGGGIFNSLNNQNNNQQNQAFGGLGTNQNNQIFGGINANQNQTTGGLFGGMNQNNVGIGNNTNNTGQGLFNNLNQNQNFNQTTNNQTGLGGLNNTNNMFGNLGRQNFNTNENTGTAAPGLFSNLSNQGNSNGIFGNQNQTSNNIMNGLNQNQNQNQGIFGGTNNNINLNNNNTMLGNQQMIGLNTNNNNNSNNIFGNLNNNIGGSLLNNTNNQQGANNLFNKPLNNNNLGMNIGQQGGGLMNSLNNLGTNQNNTGGIFSNLGNKTNTTGSFFTNNQSGNVTNTGGSIFNNIGTNMNNNLINTNNSLINSTNHNIGFQNQTLGNTGNIFNSLSNNNQNFQGLNNNIMSNVQITGSHVVKYHPSKVQETTGTGNNTKTETINLSSITAILEFSNYSIEELRYMDFQNKKKGLVNTGLLMSNTNQLNNNLQNNNTTSTNSIGINSSLFNNQNLNNNTNVGFFNNTNQNQLQGNSTGLQNNSLGLGLTTQNNTGLNVTNNNGLSGIFNSPNNNQTSNNLGFMNKTSNQESLFNNQLNNQKTAGGFNLLQQGNLNTGIGNNTGIGGNMLTNNNLSGNTNNSNGLFNNLATNAGNNSLFTNLNSNNQNQLGVNSNPFNSAVKSNNTLTNNQNPTNNSLFSNTNTLGTGSLFNNTNNSNNNNTMNTNSFNGIGTNTTGGLFTSLGTQSVTNTNSGFLSNPLNNQSKTLGNTQTQGGLFNNLGTGLSSGSNLVNKDSNISLFAKPEVQQTVFTNNSLFPSNNLMTQNANTNTTFYPGIMQPNVPVTGLNPNGIYNPFANDFSSLLNRDNRNVEEILNDLYRQSLDHNFYAYRYGIPKINHGDLIGRRNYPEPSYFYSESFFKRENIEPGFYDNFSFSGHKIGRSSPKKNSRYDNYPNINKLAEKRQDTDLLRQKSHSCETIKKTEGLVMNALEKEFGSQIDIQEGETISKYKKLDILYDLHFIIQDPIKFTFDIKIGKNKSLNLLKNMVVDELKTKYPKTFKKLLPNGFFLMKQYSFVKENQTVSECDIKNYDTLYILIKDTLTDTVEEKPKKGAKKESKHRIKSSNQSNVKIELPEFDELPFLSKQGYKTNPDIRQIYRMSKEELENVKNFEIYNEHGKIRFDEPVNLTYMNLDKIVNIESKNLTVYQNGNEEVKPEIGKGLNKAATVTMFKCFPKDKYSDKEVDKDKEKMQTFVSTLQNICKNKNAVFVDYNKDNGDWTFKVDHF